MRVMPTADASCQTEPELESKEVLNIIFDQVIRSNMRMQDLRNRSKDMQDDIKMIKRFLAMNDSKEGERMSFAIDPTEGKPKDYQDKDDEIEKRTLQLGSPWTSNISNMTRKFGLFSDLEHKPDLWPKTPPEEKLEDTKGTKGMTSKAWRPKRARRLARAHQVKQHQTHLPRSKKTTLTLTHPKTNCIIRGLFLKETWILCARINFHRSRSLLWKMACRTAMWTLKTAGTWKKKLLKERKKKRKRRKCLRMTRRDLWRKKLLRRRRRRYQQQQTLWKKKMSPVKNHQDKSRDSESRVVKTQRWSKRSLRRRRKRESHQVILSMPKDALSGLWIDNGMASWTSEVVIYWVAGVTVDWVFACDLWAMRMGQKKQSHPKCKTELSKTIWNGLFDAMPCQAKIFVVMKSHVRRTCCLFYSSSIYMFFFLLI